MPTPASTPRASLPRCSTRSARTTRPRRLSWPRIAISPESGKRRVGVVRRSGDPLCPGPDAEQDRRCPDEDLSGGPRRVPAGCPRHRKTKSRDLRPPRHAGLYPLDNAVDLTASDASLEIFKGNEAMMDAADAVIANL